MKTKKTIKLILCVVSVLSIVLCFTSCGENDVIVSNTTTTENNSVTEADTAPQPTDPTVAQPSQTTTQVQEDIQNMCSWCGEMPVGDFEPNCINCRCIKCYEIRKYGNVDSYIYCVKHNCNENNCTEAAVDDSQYCVLHKCSNPNCHLEKTLNSEYCYQHSK